MSIHQYTDAYGNTAQDWLKSYRVDRQGSLRASGGIPPYSDTFQTTFSEWAALSDGVHTFVVTAIGDGPEPYDRWTEGHEEPNHYWDEEAGWVEDGTRWVDGRREVGFDWHWNTAIGVNHIHFSIGDPLPKFLLHPSQTLSANLGTTALFSAATSASAAFAWERLPAAGGSWTSVGYAGNYRTTATPTTTTLTVQLSSLAMQGDQFRCIATNAAGSRTSASAGLTVNRVLFGGDQALVVSYLTPQQTAGPASVSFSAIFTGKTYTNANGETASDQLSSYRVFRPDGTSQVYPMIHATHHVPGAAENVYQASYSEYATLPPGVYTYGVSLRAWHPEPFDRWVEGHLEDVHENPDDPEEVTGHRWVDAHGEIGFDWGYSDIGSATVPFYIGVAPPAPSAPPTYALQPASKVIVTGAPGVLTFSASAVSEALADLKWQRRPAAGGAWVDLAPGENYAMVAGNNRTTLTITAAAAAMNGDQFRAVASNGAGSTASDSAVLTVHSVPMFVTQPASRSAAANTSVNETFTATATGNPAPTYRWQCSNGSAWVDIGWDHGWFSGIDTPTLTFSGGRSTGLWLRCVATNSAGSGWSQSARLEIIEPVRFTAHPANCTVVEGQVANFYVAVTGTPSITYLWKRRNSEGAWMDLSTDSNYTGATSANLAVWSTTVGMSGSLFQCIATNSAGSAASYYGYLTVQGPLGISTHPQSRTVVPGGSVAFTVVANGNPGPSWYEWERWDGGQWRHVGNSGGEGSYSGAFTSTLTVSNTTLAMSGYQYRCLISNSQRTLYSNAATLTVANTPGPSSGNPPVITHHPQPQAVAPGADAYFEVQATSDSPLAFQWRKNGSPLSGQTRSALVVVSVTPAEVGSYDVVVTNSHGSVTSSAAALTVDPNGQTIRFFPVQNRIVQATSYNTAQASFPVFAAATSGLPVSLSLISGPATLSNNIVTLNGPGEVTLRAAQQGGYNGPQLYNPAAAVDRSFSVVTAASVVAAGSPPPPPGPSTAASLQESVIFDLDGDGLADEIIPLGSGGFGMTVHDSDTAGLVAHIGFDLSVFGLLPGLGLMDPFQPGSGAEPRPSSMPVFRPDQPALDISIPQLAALPHYVDVTYRFPAAMDRLYTVVGEFNHRFRDNVANWPATWFLDPTRYHGHEEAGASSMVEIEDLAQDIGTVVGQPYYLIKFGRVRNLQQAPPNSPSAIDLRIPGIGPNGLPVRVGLGAAAGRIYLPIGNIGIGIFGANGIVAFPPSTAYPTGPAVRFTSGGCTVTGFPGVSTVGPGATVSLGALGSVQVDAVGNVTVNIVGGTTIRLNRAGAGGGSITFPNGAVIKVDSQGRFDLTLPAGTPQIIVDAVRVLGVVLQQTPVWVVRDILNPAAVLILGRPLLGGFDIAAATENGRLQLGVRYGNDGPVVWFTIPTSSPPSLLVDANRDGIIASGAADATSASAPYRFWLNDDDDGNALNNETEVEGSSNPDYASRGDFGIASKRDLEDFARLWINSAGIADALKSGALQIGLRWKADTVTGSPAINLYRHYEANGGTGYLTDNAVAIQQTTPPYSTTLIDAGNKNVLSSTNGVFVLKKELFANLSSSQTNTHLLFEGAGVGKGMLQLLLLDQSGAQIGEGSGVWMDVRRINTMFERVKATTQYALSSDGIDATMPLPHDYINPAQVPQPTMGWTADDRGEAFVPDPSEDLQNKNYTVFVHGWRQAPGQGLVGVSSSLTYARTMYKRLWHAGYKGRFVAFRWPTFYGGSEADDDDPLRGYTTYNDSEYRAWKAGQSLAQYVNQLPSGYKRRITAHSMGNVVAGSAFKYGMVADSYAMLNAAVPALCYEETALRRWPTFTGIYGWLTGLAGYSIPSQSPNAPNSKTPVDDVDPSIRARSYLRQLDTISATVVNFYLEADFATSISWNANNVIMRPHKVSFGNWYSYAADAYAEPDRLSLYEFSGPTHRHPSDPHEVMAYDCKVPTFTVNATGGTSGSIINRVNMQTYGFDREHSAQWQWRFQQTAQFYQRLLVEFGLTPTL